MCEACSPAMKGRGASAAAEAAAPLQRRRRALPPCRRGGARLGSARARDGAHLGRGGVSADGRVAVGRLPRLLHSRREAARRAQHRLVGAATARGSLSHLLGRLCRARVLGDRLAVLPRRRVEVGIRGGGPDGVGGSLRGWASEMGKQRSLFRSNRRLTIRLSLRGGSAEVAILSWRFRGGDCNSEVAIQRWRF